MDERDGVPDALLLGWHGPLEGRPNLPERVCIQTGTAPPWAEETLQGMDAADKQKAADQAKASSKDHSIGHVDPMAQRVWDHVSHSPVHNLWDFQGTSFKVVMQRTFKSFIDDNLVSRAAELGYYFLFALFPTLVFASSIMGLAAKSASTVYTSMLEYLAIVIPKSAYDIVISTFNQTTQASSGGKIVFGLAAALWSASVGFGAIQDTANIVYKVKETRPYWKAKLEAMMVTLLLSLVVVLALGVLLTSDYLIRRVHEFGQAHYIALGEVSLVKAAAWLLVVVLLMLLFAIIYYYAPDVKNAKWRWFSPGAAIGIFGWIVASLGLRVYLHYFNSYSATYGSLGAVIILLTWFYITGLMLLLGAEVNSEIAAAVAEKTLKEQGAIPMSATTDAEHPIECVDPGAQTKAAAS
jgi:membrane protein